MDPTMKHRSLEICMLTSHAKRARDSTWGAVLVGRYPGRVLGQLAEGLNIKRDRFVQTKRKQLAICWNIWSILRYRASCG